MPRKSAASTIHPPAPPADPVAVAPKPPARKPRAKKAVEQAPAPEPKPESPAPAAPTKRELRPEVCPTCGIKARRLYNKSISRAKTQEEVDAVRAKYVALYARRKAENAAAKAAAEVVVVE